MPKDGEKVKEIIEILIELEDDTTVPRNVKNKIKAVGDMLKGDRASVELKQKKGYLLLKIKAKDSVALRAMMNSISKLLTVHEKMKKI